MATDCVSALARIKLGVDVGEDAGQLAGAGAGGHNAVLVVAELLPDKGEVALVSYWLTSASNSAWAPPGREA